MADEIIDITDDEEQGPELLYSRRDILAPAIQHVIAALGGLEDTPSGSVYVLGDECYGCLKDLKRFWRKDDTDDERTVARIFYESAVLQRDLVPIVMQTAGKGDVENRCAIAAVDLMTGMTWPIDVAAELRELDEQEESSAVEYTTLISAQLSYKRALVTDRETLAAIFDLVVPCMAKERWNRTERDKQIVTLILYLLRNLAFIRDLPLNPNLSADQAELSSLQSRYIEILQDALVLDFLLTFASNAIDDPLANSQNTLVLEIFYLLFRSIPPTSILPSLPTANGQPKSTATSNALRSALDSEFRSSRLQKRHLTSRHSRFGTTIKVESARTGQSLILHRGAAAVQGKGTGEVLDRGKKKLAKRGKMRDELTGGAASSGGGAVGSGGETRLSYESRENLGNVAKVFVESCFNPFFSSLIKDIRAERSKVTEKDNLRLLFVTKFFIQFFLAMRERDITANVDKANGSGGNTNETGEDGADKEGKSEEEKMSLSYALVLEVVQRGWAGWILKRMREAMDMKPKQWTEIQAGLGCLTQLLLLVDAMSTSADEDLQDAAGTLQYQVYYNGEALERMLECMKSYKDQSFGYLEENIHLAYVLLRMLERWGKKNGGLYIRKSKKRKGPKSTGVPEEEGIVDDASDNDMGMNDDILQEMTLEKFEHKFANEEVTATLMCYLAKFQEFDTSEKMKWLVALMHRQAVRAKAEGLYFKVSTLAQFQIVLSLQKMLPRDQPYKDLVRLLSFLLRQFFKAVEADSLVITDALFPKNRGMWKAFSSWEPPEKGKKGRGKGDVEDSEDEQQDSLFPADIRVKRGHSWSEQLGIAIACLCEKEERHLVEWTKELLRLIIGVKQLTIDEVDKAQEQEPASDEEEEATEKPNGDNPSMAALAKLEDFIIPYTEDGRAEAATKNAHLKLLFTLIGFQVVDKAATEWEWICPGNKLPADLQRSLNLINNFLLDPLDLNGKKALQMISKPSKRKTLAKKVRTAPTEQGFNGGILDDSDEEEGDGERRKRGSSRAEKKKKEKQQTISAQFIEDSDVEIGDDEAFFAKERALRDRMNKAASSGVATQGAGTKRKKGEEEDGGGSRKRQRKSVEGTKKKKSTKTKSSSEESSEEEARTVPTFSQLENTLEDSDDEPLIPTQAKANGSTVGSPPPSSRAPSSRFNSDDDEESAAPRRLANGKRISTASSAALHFSESEMEEEDLPPATQNVRVARQTKRLVISDEEED